ncbi:MAG: ATP synthase F0 subunit C [Deltaproteobacteria bacterium]|nr:ATP synthase F0 subunit C [Deltaproteobacteria bacterium]
MKRKVIGIGAFVASIVAAGLAFAEDAAGGATSTGAGIGFLGVVIGMGLASLGGALGQGRVAAAAVDGIARNPGASSKVQTPMILALALIESLVLLSFLMAFMAQGKLH